MNINRPTTYLYALLALSSLMNIAPSYAAPINSESVTFFEKPIALDIDYGVIELNNSVEIGYQSDNNNTAKYDFNEIATHLAFYSQLENDWDITLEYLGNYANERADSYQDLLRLGVRDQWGEIQVGNVAAIIYERTNRQRAFGLLGADNDEFSLPLNRYGLFYQWSTPASGWMLAIDKDANVEVGTSHYLPKNGVEYTLSARANYVRNDEGDPQGISESTALALVAQVERGRWTADTQFMQEKLAALANSEKFTLNTVSAGLHYRFNQWQWSLTGVTRENELNDKERILSLGLGYDIARGLSLNAGTNMSSSALFPERFRSHALSLKYEF